MSQSAEKVLRLSLDRMIGGGLIALERARVIVYRPEQSTR